MQGKRKWRVGGGRWMEDWWRWRYSDERENSPAVLCTGYDPHFPLPINHHHFLCYSCATSICGLWLKALISDSMGGGVKPPHSSPALLSFLCVNFQASSVLFCCQFQTPPPCLSFLSTSCLPFSWRLHLPLSPIRNLTPTFRGYQ